MTGKDRAVDDAREAVRRVPAVSANFASIDRTLTAVLIELRAIRRLLEGDDPPAPGPAVTPVGDNGVNTNRT